MLSKSNKYIRIDSDFFQGRLSAVLELFENYENKERYAVVETYEPLEVKPLEPEYIESFNLLPIRKRYLTENEKLLIDEYFLALH